MTDAFLLGSPPTGAHHLAESKWYQLSTWNVLGTSSNFQDYSFLSNPVFNIALLGGPLGSLRLAFPQTFAVEMKERMELASKPKWTDDATLREATSRLRIGSDSQSGSKRRGHHMTLDVIHQQPVDSLPHDPQLQRPANRAVRRWGIHSRIPGV